MKKIILISVFALANCKADSATLLNIANQNALDGGDAVYSARTMLRIFIEPVSGEKIQQENTSEEIPNYNYKLYPNPNDGKMTIEYVLDSNKTGEFKIYDVAGQKVAEYKLIPEQNSISISEAALKNGVYFYLLIVEGKIISRNRIVIIK